MMQGCASSMGSGTVTLSEGLSQLKTEHVPLYEKLHGLFDLCSKIDDDDSIEEAFQQLKPAVKIFMDELEPHSEREERVLFRMMEKYLGVGMGPIAVMEYEHEQAKALIGLFFERTKDNEKTYSEAEIKENSDLIKKAYFTLTEHFGKEENVLFPMAERMFTEEEKKELHEKITQI